jgi:phage repressor protein C with HTH and peptisase S24 domain
MARPPKAQPVLTHEQIWTALERLAERAGLSASGLARKSGLDPTTFNKSKRVTADGRERWPSTDRQGAGRHLQLGRQLRAIDRR